MKKNPKQTRTKTSNKLKQKTGIKQKKTKLNQRVCNKFFEFLDEEHL